MPIIVGIVIAIGFGLILWLMYRSCMRQWQALYGEDEHRRQMEAMQRRITELEAELGMNERRGD